MNSESRLGGGGQCPYCQKYDGNLAYHEAWECVGNPRGFNRTDLPETICESKPPKPKCNLCFGQGSFTVDGKLVECPCSQHECSYDADGASCNKCGKSASEQMFPKEIGAASTFIPGETALVDSIKKPMSTLLPEEKAKLRQLREDIDVFRWDGGILTPDAIDSYNNYLESLALRYKDQLLTEWAKQKLEEESES